MIVFVDQIFFKFSILVTFLILINIELIEVHRYPEIVLSKKTNRTSPLA